MEFVFGYGSLAAVADPHERVIALNDHHRHWGVAMDNSKTFPGYKCFVREDGSQPALYVAFLDVVTVSGSVVNGVCRPVTAEQLAALDARERNYHRRDVTTQIEDPPGRVWAYVGSTAGRARLETGRQAGTAVVCRAYRDAVLQGFERLGAAELARFHASTDFDGLPVHDLRRVDLSD
jgi:gamma-glutamylcyclotransferase (GGCT)/AIG2-like uncharacterized protein YtfP